MSGLVKPKQYNIADSNIANLGSDLEKKVKAEAAHTEKAWANAGKKIGIEIWRIEKFKVVAVPVETYGSFYSGDSYILLNTYKKKPDSDALAWDIHFWLGKYTTQDEAGTAAYKTVELDDILSGAAVQHREVQGYESDLFLSYFKNQIRILEGGVDSGFKHVKPEEYKPRLLHMKGVKKIRVTEVDLHYTSLNEGDAFLLDAGLHLYQWAGKSSGPGERTKARELATAIKSERKGLPQVHVLSQGEKGEDVDAFWKALGGEGPVKTAAEGGDDKDAEKEGSQVRRLFRLSDSSGKLEFTLVAQGNAIKRSQLDSNDVFIFDVGQEVFAWIGHKASVDEKSKALSFAQDYLTKFNRPLYLPISRLLEGRENSVFETAFH